MNRKRRPPVVTVVLAPGDDRVHLPLHEVEYGDASAAPSIVVWPHVPDEAGGADARNRAAARAESRYVAFLAAGARPEPDWVRNAVDILERDISLAGVGSRVLDAEGRPAGMGSAMLAFFGQPYEWPPALPHCLPDEARDVLFPSAAAMVLRRGPFLEVGGFDERFVGVLDEVDLGWRLWLAGYRVRYEPAVSVVLQPEAAEGHRSGETVAHDSEEIHRLRERNALATIYKNYSEQTLGRCLPAAMALAVRRDRQQGAAAVDGFVELLPALAAARRQVQAGRVRSDQEVLRLFGQPPVLLEAGAPDPSCGDDLRTLDDAFALAETFGRRRKIVIVTEDTLGPRMAGPAIRAWHIALALSVEHDVELVTTRRCSMEHPRFRCRSVTARQLRELESWCDILLFQGWVMASYPWLKDSSKVLVVDIYDPFHLEGLEQAKDLGEEQRRAVFRNSVAALNDQLLRGDLFLCASAKQRDFWLGQLSALGRLNPVTYDEDETMSSLLAVVPFGLSPNAPVHSNNVIKGVLNGIGPDDKVVLWGGGIYNWLDPLTLIRAVDQVRHERADVRLFFLGVQHPNPGVPEMRMAHDARALADSLGLLNRHVFFNEGWVPYEERANYLLEADIAVSTHLDHVETAFSFRTRMLDYLWAGLPIVATRGDTFSELVEHEGIGLTVPAEDVDSLADALLRLLDDEGLAASCRKNAAAVAPRFSWSRTLQPLIEFCRWPRRAPDLLRPELVGLGPAPQLVPPVPPAPLGLRGDLALIRTYLRDGGVPLLVEKVHSRARRVRRRMVRADPGRTAGPHAGTF